LSVLKLVEYPSDILETKCKQVTTFNKDLIQLLESMYETMIEADGVGLAAPQVGIGEQIAIVDIDDEHGRIDLINPVILEMKGEQIGPEGCLSFPGLFGEVNRANYVKVQAQDSLGKTFILEAEGFLSRAIQHEIDHLNGVLFTSKVTRYYEEGELEG
jgi:peptide deformylase